jgi:hypothetical protein
MLGAVSGLLPVMMFSVLAFWRPETLYGTIFLFPAGGSLIVGLTWRASFPGPAGLGVSVLLVAYSFFCIGCFIKVLSESRRGSTENVSREGAEDE